GGRVRGGERGDRPRGTGRWAGDRPQPPAPHAHARALHRGHVRRPLPGPLPAPDRTLRPRFEDCRPGVARLYGPGLALAALLRLDRRPLRHALHWPGARLDRGYLRDDRLRADLPDPGPAGRSGRDRLGRLSPARRGQRQRRDPARGAQPGDVGLRHRRHDRRRPRPADRRGPLLRLRGARHGADGPARRHDRPLAPRRAAQDRAPAPGGGRGDGGASGADPRRPAGRDNRRDDGPLVDRLQHPGLRADLVPGARVRRVLLRAPHHDDRAGFRARHPRLRRAGRPLGVARGGDRLDGAERAGDPPLRPVHRPGRLCFGSPGRGPCRLHRATDAGHRAAADARAGRAGLRTGPRPRLRDGRDRGAGDRRGRRRLGPPERRAPAGADHGGRDRDRLVPAAGGGAAPHRRRAPGHHVPPGAGPAPLATALRL
ncbi:MAG: hypothetical protein AVDCRST_MAG88-3216, partial [uncultured Thermomicrobiales bacterium]